MIYDCMYCTVYYHTAFQPVLHIQAAAQDRTICGREWERIRLSVLQEHQGDRIL